VYRIHIGARAYLLFIGVGFTLFTPLLASIAFNATPPNFALWVILLGFAAVAVWAWWALACAGLRLDEHSVAATYLFPQHVSLTGVRRLGLGAFPARGCLHSIMLGAWSGKVLWIQDHHGGTTRINLSVFRQSDDFLEELRRRVGRDYEPLEYSPWSGVRWP
jgi:hypothetical protein